MKAKYALVILILGFCFDFIGALFKIMHSREADTILTLAAILKVLGAVLLLYKLITYPKWKDFLNH